jgi:6-phosphogluconolactonase
MSRDIGKGFPLARDRNPRVGWDAMEGPAPRILVGLAPEPVGETVAGRLAGLVTGKAPFRIALPGGATPLPFFRALARKLPPGGSGIDFFWSDERVVPHDHSDANIRAAREALLGPVGVPTDRIHPVPPDPAAYAREIARVFGTDAGGAPPAFDLVLLGMGGDGHTASLFPGIPELDEPSRWVVATRAPVAPHDRVSFSLPLINRARRAWFIVTGKGKAERVREVFDGADLPAGRVRGREETLWFLDEAAASRLDERTPRDGC